jgi:histidinol-phosphate aminotransferase
VRFAAEPAPPPGAAESLRLHAGENAYGASPAARRAILEELDRMHRYPDSASTELVEAVAGFHDVPAERVSVANGMDEVILLLVLALADERRAAVVTDATFASYRESLGAARQPFTRIGLRDYRVPVADIAAQLRAGAPFAFVCTPHNPTGTVLDAAELATLAAAAADGGGVLLVDEAYAEYAGAEFASAMPYAATGGHVCVLRTFSKAYGLAGLRVGYVVGDPTVIARVGRLHSAVPYHVNRLAQRAAVAALADQRFMRESVRRTVETRELFRLGLLDLGLPCPPSHGNFVLVPLGGDSAAATLALRERGFAVRDTVDMGLPGHIRVSIGTPEQMSAVLDAFAALLAPAKRS